MNRSTIKYLLALLLFGSNGIVASRISMNSYEIVMFRTLIGSLLLIVLYLATNHRFTFYKHKKSFAFLALSGIAMGVSWLFLFEAYQRIGVSIASLGYYCGPVIVMALSPLLFKERLTRRRIGCFFIVFIGILLVNSQAFHESHNLTGIACALMSAVMYACMVSFNKKADQIVGYLEPLSAILFSFLFLGEHLYPIQIAGALCIIAGAVGAELKQT